jgi:FlaA1/EpsC-like NDP-sugar epimerase
MKQGLPLAAFVDLDPRKIGQQIHGASVLDPEGFEDMVHDANPYVLAAVGSPGAREEIRVALNAMGRREIADFRVCA